MARFRDVSMSNITEAICRSAVTSAYDLEAAAIISPTESGYTARWCLVTGLKSLFTPLPLKKPKVG